MQVEVSPRWRTVLARLGALGLLVVLSACGSAMSGTYQKSGGTDTIEFRTGGSCYMNAFGSTMVGTYEVDGDRVVLNFPNGAIVLTRHGETLQGGDAGDSYVRQ